VFRGRVLRGRTVSFFGAGGAGKSTLADGLALSLASGVGVVPMWVPVAPMTVALLDWDEGEHEWLARTAAICRGHGVSPAGQYVYIPLAAPLVASVDYVAREISKRHISVLIVSPVSRAIRQISEDRDPAGAVHELYELLRELGTTNILIDHVAAASMREESLSKEYGSVAKRDNARGSFAIKALSQIPGRRVIQITNTKPPPLTPKIPDQEVAIHYDPPNSLDGQYNSIRFTDNVR
jgi:RecA-family ATPase